MPEKVTDFTDVRNWFTAHPANRLKLDSLPGMGEEEIHRHWPDIGDADCPRFRDFLNQYVDPKNTKPQRWVQDPIAGKGRDGKTQATYPGIYRLVGNHYDVEARGKPGIWQVLRKGWITTLAEAWAAVQQDKAFTFKANSQSVPGVTTPSTTSNDPAWVLFLNINSVDPKNVNTISASIHAHVETTLDGVVAIGGNEYAGMKCISATAKLSDDGSAQIDIVLATARVTFKLVDNKGARDEKHNYVIHSVPCDEAQAIADAWETLAPTQGKSTGITLYEETGFCMVHLMAPGIIKSNFDTDWIQIDLYTWHRWHFAWGYTKAEIGTWQNDHNIAITDTGTEPTPAANDCQMRKVDVGLPRADGFYDGVIIETRFGPRPTHAAADLSILVCIGTKITVQHDYGIRMRKHEISHTDLLGLYNATSKAVGRRVEFRVTKEDQWTFDYEAVITMQSEAISGSVPLVSEGFGVTPVHHLGANLEDETQLKAIKFDLLPGPRRVVSADLKMREDGLAEVSGSIRHLAKMITDIRVGNALAPIVLTVGANIDPEDLEFLKGELAMGENRRVEIDASDSKTLKLVSFVTKGKEAMLVANANPSRTVPVTDIGEAWTTTSAPFKNKPSPPATSEGQFVSGLDFKDTETYDGILHTLTLLINPDNTSIFMINQVGQRERQPHMFTERTKVRQVRLSTTAADPEYFDDGENVLSVVYQWYRDNSIMINREYSLTYKEQWNPDYRDGNGKPAPAPFDMDGEVVIKRVGGVWIRESKTVIIGNWTFDAANFNWMWLFHVTEQGVFIPMLTSTPPVTPDIPL